jgi:phosphonate transport system permease protein
MRFVTPRGRPSANAWVLAVGLPAALALTWPLFGVAPQGLSESLGNMGRFLGRFARSPDFAYLPRLGGLLIETVLIAFVATTVAATVSLAVAFLAARNATPHPLVALTARGVASVMRSIPDLLLALLLASALGLGQVPGVLALAFATVGFLVKAYAEALETVDRRPIEGLAAHGAGWLGVRTLAIFPQAAPDLVGLTLYGLDSNVRAATILGFVGAGGIGYDLTKALRLFQFERLGLLLLSVYLMVTAIDRLSDALRRRLA